MNFARTEVNAPKRCTLCGSEFAYGATIYAGTLGDRGEAAITGNCCASELVTILAIGLSHEREEGGSELATNA
jgi:hypothetical protein